MRRKDRRRRPRREVEATRPFVESLESRQLLAAILSSDITSVVWNGRAVQAVRDSYIVRMPQANKATAVAAWDYQSATPQVAAGWSTRSLGYGYYSVSAPKVAASDVLTWSTRIGVNSIVPNRVISKAAVPPQPANDPRYTNGDLWGLNNTGLLGGKADADIDAPEAWGINTGSRDIVVVVMDEGVDYTHPDLQPNMWMRDRAIATVPAALQSEFKARYGQFGWDSADNDADVKPLLTDSHGTHVAGTIGAVGNNRLGVTGVNWNVSMYSAKIFGDGGGSASAEAEYDAFARVLDLRLKYNQNVIVVNASFGYYAPSPDGGEYDFVSKLNDAGIVLCAAAGNGGSPEFGNDGLGDCNDIGFAADKTQINQHWPSSMTVGDGFFFPPLPNVIAVAASTRTDELTRFSDWGTSAVLIAAPGQDILSTVPIAKTTDANTPAGYGVKSGTSMATPHVSGVVALVAAEYKRWTRQLPSVSFVKRAILEGADKVSSLKYARVKGDNPPGPVGLEHRVQGDRRLNAFGSLDWTDKNLPPGISVSQVTPLQLEGDIGQTTSLQFAVSLTAFYQDPVSQKQMYIPVPAATDIVVSYVTEQIPPTAAGREATSGVDYVAITTPRTFTIPKGSSSTVVSLVDVIGDNQFEQIEQFKVVFKGVVSGDAWLRTDFALGTIVNDDPSPLAPAVTVASPTLTVEEGTPGPGGILHSVPITIDGGGGVPGSRPVTVSYRIMPSSPVSAVPGQDFYAQTGTLSIPAGTTSARIPFRVIDDKLKEPDKTFIVELTNVTPGVLKVGKTQCVVTITDNDTATPVTPPGPPSTPGLIITGPASVVEGSGSNSTVTFKLALDAPASQLVRVVYSLVNGSASSGSDFVGTGGQAVIQPGQTSGQFTVQIVGDTRVESDETFTVRINTVTGATYSGLRDFLVTIVDDDATVTRTAQPLAIMPAVFASLASQSVSGGTTPKRSPAAIRT